MRWQVLVVEDDDLTRSLIVSLLRSHGIDVVADAASAAEALKALGAQRVDAALLDLDLGPGPSGLDLAHELRHRFPEIGLVLLTSYTDPRLKDPEVTIPRGLVYLTKQDGTDAAAVIAALRQAIAAPTASQPKPPHTALTQTQIEVLAGLASGRTTAQIAADRAVTVKAVEQVIARLCEILEVPRDSRSNSRVQLVRKYQELTGQLP